MTKIIKTFILYSLFFIVACSRTDCDQLPKKFSSCDEAVKTIKATHFKVEESVNTSKSSWVRGAYYYSCDGVPGFFILKTDNQYYLYSNVPSEIWQGLKNSKSFGSYYNQYIKDKYVFNLNQ
jgi:hypothetical protein